MCEIHVLLNKLPFGLWLFCKMFIIRIIVFHDCSFWSKHMGICLGENCSKQEDLGKIIKGNQQDDERSCSFQCWVPDTISHIYNTNGIGLLKSINLLMNESTLFKVAKARANKPTQITKNMENKRCRMNAVVSPFWGGGTSQILLSANWSWKNNPDAVSNNAMELIAVLNIVPPVEVSEMLNRESRIYSSISGLMILSISTENWLSIGYSSIKNPTNVRVIKITGAKENIA